MEKVVLIKSPADEDEQGLYGKLHDSITSRQFFDCINKNDLVAIKTHFGESINTGYVKPFFIKLFGDTVKSLGGRPFLTETSTLYKGERANSVFHIQLAHEHGFNYENTGLPVIMADGLRGEDGMDVSIPGKIFSQINVASLIVKSDALIVISHFTGHLLAGFGGAIKNLAMGCVSKKGKLLQHAKSKPVIQPGKCTSCHECRRWCPVNAIIVKDGSLMVDAGQCIGCGQCLSICRSDAVDFDWNSSGSDFQKRLIEHAWGVYEAKQGKVIFINFLTNISKNCDCVKSYRKIVPDIGVLIARDPLAIDLASLECIEQASGKSFSELTKISYQVQLEYARETGFGDANYDLEIYHD
jgi:uncharacterized Fe-S center protein